MTSGLSEATAQCQEVLWETVLPCPLLRPQDYGGDPPGAKVLEWPRRSTDWMSRLLISDGFYLPDTESTLASLIRRGLFWASFDEGKAPEFVRREKPIRVRFPAACARPGWANVRDIMTLWKEYEFWESDQPNDGCHLSPHFIVHKIILILAL